MEKNSRVGSEIGLQSLEPVMHPVLLHLVDLQSYRNIAILATFMCDIPEYITDLHDW